MQDPIRNRHDQWTNRPDITLRRKNQQSWENHVSYNTLFKAKTSGYPARPTFSQFAHLLLLEVVSKISPTRRLVDVPLNFPPHFHHLSISGAPPAVRRVEALDSPLAFVATPPWAAPRKASGRVTPRGAFLGDLVSEVRGVLYLEDYPG